MEEDKENLFFGNEEEKGKKSIWHGGATFIERLDILFRYLDATWIPIEYLQNRVPTFKGLTYNQYEKILSLLSSLFRELSPKMEPELRNKHNSMKIKAENLFYSESNNFRSRMINTNFTEIFNNWELELRAFAESKGLIMPEKRGGLDAADD